MTSGSAIKKAATFTLLLPRNAAVLILRGYRAVISPLYGDVCRYYPSCSRYTLEAIQEYGLVRGTGARGLAHPAVPSVGGWRGRGHPPPA